MRLGGWLTSLRSFFLDHSPPTQHLAKGGVPLKNFLNDAQGRIKQRRECGHPRMEGSTIPIFSPLLIA
jgi:hypothetical protein